MLSHGVPTRSSCCGCSALPRLLVSENPSARGFILSGPPDIDGMALEMHGIAPLGSSISQDAAVQVSGADDNEFILQFIT